MSKVSIIIPVYNSEKYLERCLDSLISQTIDDIEIILIDDKSTDKSYNIMKKYQEKEPRKIKLIKNPENMGPGAARNLGLSIATGEYIGFVDSDDYIDEDMYQKLYEAGEREQADIARTNRKIVMNNHNLSFLGRNGDYTKRQVINPKKELEYLSIEYPAATNKIFRRELLEGRKFPEHLKWEDYPFVVPLLYKADSVVAVVGTTYYYTMNPSGTTVTDVFKISPKLLDIFTCSDSVIEEILQDSDDETLEERVNFIAIQNCLQRTRDILYSDIPMKDKKELISLVSALINKKYGRWQDNSLYQEYKNSRRIYKARMHFIERNLLDTSYEKLEEQELEEKIKQKVKK
jgi:glycosyltransferase involved in cell wall biosynthesis